MKKFLCLSCILGAVLLAALPHAPSAAAISKKKPKTAPPSAESYGRLPLRFERNDGQTDASVKYLARGHGYSLLLTETDAVIALHKDAASLLRMNLANAQTASKIEGEELLATQTTYLIGNDPSRWRRNVPSYGRVRYSAVYPGIDLVYYGRERELEFDFVVAKGADPKAIRMMFDGAKRKRIDPDGNLVLKLDDGEILLHRPVMYQKVNEEQREVRGSFLIDRSGRVGFRVGKYDRRRELVIDPVLSYSTYLGGSGSESATGITVDDDGNTYVVGRTDSTDFPLPGPGPIQNFRNGEGDAYIAKINPEGTGLVYSTYLGGSSEELARGIAVDAVGSVYVTGITTSPDFPIVSGGAQTSYGGIADAFIIKLNAAGSALLYSTYLGGVNSDDARGIALDGDGNAYVAGSTESIAFTSVSAVNEKTGRPFYRTTDGGANWAADTMGASPGNVTAVAIDPANPNTIYAGANYGIFKSNDGGANWAETGLNLGLPVFNINTIVVDPTNPSTIYISAFVFLYKSTDGGANLTSILVEDLNPATLVIDPATPTTLYAGGLGGVFKSTNGGMTWNPSNNGLGLIPNSPNVPQVYKLVIDPTNPLTLYAATNFRMFKTIDGGANWMQINNGLLSTSAVRNLAIDPSSPQTLYLDNRSGILLKTIDGGANWTEAATGLMTAFNAITVDPANSSVIYLGTSGAGVLKSIDGGASFTPVNQGLGNRMVQTLLIHPTTTTNILAGTDAGNDIFVAKLDATGASIDYLRFIGGHESEGANGIAVDTAGHAYLIGGTNSTDFPLVAPIQSVYGGFNDAFVTKVSADGTALIYSTYLGGTGNEGGTAIAVSSVGETYVGGMTASDNFPVINAIRPVRSSSNSDGFVTKINAAGSALVYSTYIGGSGGDSITALALATTGEVAIVGPTSSQDFPLIHPIQSVLNFQDIFVARLDAAGSALTFSTYLGGSGSDGVTGVAVDALGDIYLTGTTQSLNFPTVNPIQPFRGADSFVAKIISRADLQLSLTAARPTTIVNGELTYTATVFNTGPDTARNATFTDAWSPAATFVSAVSDHGPCERTTVVMCNFGDLAPGESATVTIVIRPAQLGTITNTAVVSSLTNESAAADNTAVVVTNVAGSPSINGRVTLPDGSGLAGVMIGINTGFQAGPFLTNSDGSYEITGLSLLNNYVITPFLQGYAIRPGTQYIPSLSGDATANFTALPCVCTIAPSELVLTSWAHIRSVEITASEPDCQWEAFSNASWLTITPSAVTVIRGYGSGTVSFIVDSNLPGLPARSGSITIAGKTFSVKQGAGFYDVQLSHPFFNEIGKLSALGITSGCGDGNFCPGAVVSREQMAIFLIRALGEFNPPEPTMQRFADVPPENPFYAFIEQMAVRGITLGCGNGNYCPGAPVTREQMAVLIIRALGEFDPPPPAMQRFLDVPPENPFYRFIEEMAVRQITVGCGGGNYCPSAVVTREQMAAFLARAFGW